MAEGQAAPNADTGALLRRLIARSGPLSLSQFMGESNARYYDARDPLGEAGDFVTAPEISQMFGEMVGLWLADLWRRAGAPGDALYVELGPGRGTLAADALRAGAPFGFTPQVHFVEGSTALRQAQARAVPDARFHADLSTVPEDAPLLIVANEFLDALPVRQLVRTAHGWRERMVGLADAVTDTEAAPDAPDATPFVFVAGERPMDAAVPERWADAPVETVLEASPASAAVMGEVARRLAAQGGAALFVDYGHAEPRTGSTLQAVRAHRKVDALAMPGAADLTAHVDFATMADIARQHGARVTGIAEQGDFLTQLGIGARARALAARAPDPATVATDLARLTDGGQMGSLFKVLGLAGPDWPDGAGFAR